MNISYQWLRSYIDTELTPEQVATALTSIGLECGTIEEVESIPGGLRGLVMGEVLTCVPHENSDHLHVTTVNIGGDAPLQIVCGAPNVRAGMGVVVATVGTVLGSGEEQFTIKKSKIRGVESFGMLCSEVEIGIGGDNSGIILLPLSDIRVGMPASEHFGVTSDYVLEVDITPNRVDATSHYGVARDLAAYHTQHISPIVAHLPEVAPLEVGQSALSVAVEGSQEVVPRFESVVIRGLKVGDSPEWLRRRLESIGLRAINVVIDVTNYVLHEVGQPLHAYDLDKVQGGAMVVGLASEGSRVVTLDGIERTLSADDIVISDATGQVLCVGGVMGSLGSGTTEATEAIVLESANFNASYVRRTARRLGISSDSSFRFERGLDPERTHWALERATSLILELCPGSYVDGSVDDHYPKRALPSQVELDLSYMDRFVGEAIPEAEVARILESLDITIVARSADRVWTLAVPRYRVDVVRQVDVIEEILRIWGYNQVPLTGYIHASLSAESAEDRAYRRRQTISEQLTGAGFSEILCNSLTAEAYYEGLTSHPTAELVRLANPLSAELGVLRSTLLFGGLGSISRNARRQQRSFYFYEWGNCYSYTPSTSDNPMRGYHERRVLGLWIGGERVSGSWAHPNEETSPFELKAHVQHILSRLSINPGLLRYEQVSYDLYAGSALEIKAQSGKLIGRLGAVHSTLLAAHEVETPIYYAELEWDALVALADKSKSTIHDLPKYPMVKRDLSLLIDSTTSFVEIEAVAYKAERKLLKRCELFDVYDGKNLPEGKKSYAVAFYLQDETATMSDKQIEAVMSKIQRSLETQLGASLR